jgi:hypothetical protein
MEYKQMECNGLDWGSQERSVYRLHPDPSKLTANE